MFNGNAGFKVGGRKPVPNVNDQLKRKTPLAAATTETLNTAPANEKSVAGLSKAYLASLQDRFLAAEKATKVAKSKYIRQHNATVIANRKRTKEKKLVSVYRQKAGAKPTGIQKSTKPTTSKAVEAARLAFTTARMAFTTARKAFKTARKATHAAKAELKAAEALENRVDREVDEAWERWVKQQAVEEQKKIWNRKQRIASRAVGARPTGIQKATRAAVTEGRTAAKASVRDKMLEDAVRK
jgi:hypothetical protein